MLKKEKVKKIADLARLELSDRELEDLREDLSSVLDYVDKLKEVDTSQVDDKPLFEVENNFRKDKLEDSPEEMKEKMRAQGKEKDEYFKVESI